MVKPKQKRKIILSIPERVAELLTGKSDECIDQIFAEVKRIRHLGEKKFKITGEVIASDEEQARLIATIEGGHDIIHFEEVKW